MTSSQLQWRHWVRKIGDNTGDDWSTSFLFQRISVLVQRFNAVLLNDSFMLEHHLD